jgi:hypothetical protein
MDLEGSGSGLNKMLSWHLLEGTEENHEKNFRQDSRCLDQDLN